MMPRIGILVMTDGRYDYVLRTVLSLLSNVWPRGPLVMFDDSGDAKYADWLRVKFPNFEVHAAPRRMGIVRAHWRAFRHMARRRDVDWVFLLQDDFLFSAPLDLTQLVEVMRERPNLAQIVLRRQPWYPEEIAAGGIFEHHGRERFTEHTDGVRSWVEHRAFFSLNPMLTRRSLLASVPYPLGAKGEHSFGERILAARPDSTFAYWGRMADRPLVTHIGKRQAGGYGY